MNVVEFLSQLNEETEVLLSLSIILFSGFILTRMTNTLNMPKVSGYILAGILIGPCCFNFIPKSMIDGMSFVSDLALSFIAFGVGKFFKKEVLMRTGKKIIVITISEALAAGVLVTFCLKFIFDLNWEFALILGAIATATAPASTMMTINQYKAKGEFVDTLLQIVALDDVVCLLAFSIVSAIINGNAAGGFSVHDILIPVAYNLLVIVLGIFCGYFLSRLLIPARSRDNRLILAIAMLLGLSGICAAIDISPLLSCMVFGAVYINLTRDKKLFRQINSFTPPVMSVFFIVSGMNLDLNALKAVGAIGVSYFVIRIIGKYMGTYLSCLFMGTSKAIRNYMGFALIPQAGVAIGLAFLGQRMLPPETGNLMLTIILSSSVLYEMVGPVSAKAALMLSGSIPFGKRAEGVEGPEESEKQESAEDVLPDSGMETMEEAESETGTKAWTEPEVEGGGKAEKPAKTEGEKTAKGTGEAEAEKTAKGTGEAEAEKTAESSGKTAEENGAEALRLPEGVGTSDSTENEADRSGEKESRKKPEAGKEEKEKEPEAGEKNQEKEPEAGKEEKEKEPEAGEKEPREEPEAGEKNQEKEPEAGKEEREKEPEIREGKAEKGKGKAVSGKNKERRGKKSGKESDRKARTEEPAISMEAEYPDEPEPEEEEDHAVLPELREYSKGVEEHDVYDIEKEVKPQKSKKKKKGKKADAKAHKE